MRLRWTCLGWLWWCLAYVQKGTTPFVRRVDSSAMLLSTSLRLAKLESVEDGRLGLELLTVCAVGALTREANRGSDATALDLSGVANSFCSTG
jgi:hypothetical protein